MSIPLTTEERVVALELIERRMSDGDATGFTYDTFHGEPTPARLRSWWSYRVCKEGDYNWMPLGWQIWGGGESNPEIHVSIFENGGERATRHGTIGFRELADRLRGALVLF